MWNPMVHFDRKQVGTVHGWHRSFCLYMDRRDTGRAPIRIQNGRSVTHSRFTSI
ncbi:gamma-glutamylcyclotransferase [Paraburkholderia sp. EB58]|uniref:gamma-glutamylcyclotransferase n=1 Tax=Paraburkholderia sp. EB58 TaxID=3035125 RepID=UPI003D250157